MKEHNYSTTLEWTGNDGVGTRSYTSYRRDFTIASEGKPTLAGSSDPAFRGDATRYNPEEMLVASLSSCHMLWYLHLCSVNEIIVVSYRDRATGAMEESASGAGRFRLVTLQPEVVIAAGGDLAKAASLHRDAHEFCYIANSVNFPVEVANASVTEGS